MVNGVYQVNLSVLVDVDVADDAEEVLTMSESEARQLLADNVLDFIETLTQSGTQELAQMLDGARLVLPHTQCHENKRGRWLFREEWVVHK